MFVLAIFWAATWQNQQSDCAPSEDSDQPRHPSSLMRVFAVRMKKAWVLSYPLSAQRRLWSDWADAQADLSLRWVHSHFVGFVMSRLFYFCQLFWVSASLLTTFQSLRLRNHSGARSWFERVLIVHRVNGKDWHPGPVLFLLSDRQTPKCEIGRGSSIGSVFAWHASGPGFDPHVRHILSWRLGHENISTAILPLPLIQEEQLSVTGERMCTKYW